MFRIRPTRPGTSKSSRGVWRKGFKKSKNNHLVLIKDAFAMASKKNDLDLLMAEYEAMKDNARTDSILGRHRRSTDGSSAPPAPPQPKPKSVLPKPALPKPKPKKRETIRACLTLDSRAVDTTESQRNDNHDLKSI